MIFVIVFLIILIMWFVITYNNLVTLRNRVENAWHQIEVQLERRYDLIPNLINIVKGYSKHEKEIFEKIAELRTRAIEAKSVDELTDANNQLTQVLRTVFAVAENYPELKANQNFLELQEELVNTENKIAYSRQFYNDIVTKYNTAVQMLPTNIIAMLMGFSLKEYCHINTAEMENVGIQF